MAHFCSMGHLLWKWLLLSHTLFLSWRLVGHHFFFVGAPPLLAAVWASSWHGDCVPTPRHIRTLLSGRTLQEARDYHPETGQMPDILFGSNSSLHDHIGERVGNRIKRCRKWRQLVTVCVSKHMSVWLVEIKIGILVWLLSSGQKIKWTGKCEKSKMKGIISLSWFRYGSCSL